MALNVSVAVIGAAVRPDVEDESQSLEELLYAVSQDALRDAGLTIEQIDGIVVASNDQFDGRAISIMMASGSVGGVDRDILATPSASEHAFVMGVLRVATGQYQTHLIVGWSPTEASSLAEAQRLGNDPYFHRRLPQDELSAFALQASALEARRPGAGEAAREIAAANRVGRAPRSEARPRWPLEPDMISPPVSGVVAMVIASESFVRARDNSSPAWLRGLGWATETAFLGDRDLASAPALEEAARRAFSEAGLHDPASELDVIELTDATPYQRLIVLDALGFSSHDRWAEDVRSGRLGPDGPLPINPSGGVAAANPVFCTGLIRIAEAANQVRGKAGDHQVADAALSLAHAASGFAMTYQSVLIFGREPGEKLQ